MRPLWFFWSTSYHVWAEGAEEEVLGWWTQELPICKDFLGSRKKCKKGREECNTGEEEVGEPKLGVEK